MTSAMTSGIFTQAIALEKADPEHFDLARGRMRQVDNPVNRDVGKSWDHQLTRPRDPAWAPKARLCR